MFSETIWISPEWRLKQLQESGRARSLIPSVPAYVHLTLTGGLHTDLPLPRPGPFRFQRNSFASFSWATAPFARTLEENNPRKRSLHFCFLRFCVIIFSSRYLVAQWQMTFYNLSCVPLGWDQCYLNICDFWNDWVIILKINPVLVCCPCLHSVYLLKTLKFGFGYIATLLP